jgi:hypothetical protein
LDRRNITMALKFGLTRIEFSDAMAPVRFSHDGRQMIVMPIRPETAPAQTAAAPAEAPNAPEAANPVNPDAHQPATENTVAQPEKANMATTTTTPASNGNGQHSNETAETKGPLELALDQIETIKGSYREAVRGLNGLAETLKQAQREQKNSHKEVQSVRATLRSLQSVRI